MFAVALQAARVVAYASIILDLRRSVSLPPWELLTIITVIVVGFGESTIEQQTQHTLITNFPGFFVATEAIAPGVLLQLSTRDAYVCVDQQYETSLLPLLILVLRSPQLRTLVVSMHGRVHTAQRLLRHSWLLLKPSQSQCIRQHRRAQSRVPSIARDFHHGP